MGGLLREAFAQDLACWVPGALWGIGSQTVVSHKTYKSEDERV